MKKLTLRQYMRLKKLVQEYDNKMETTINREDIVPLRDEIEIQLTFSNLIEETPRGSEILHRPTRDPFKLTQSVRNSYEKMQEIVSIAREWITHYEMQKLIEKETNFQTWRN